MAVIRGGSDGYQQPLVATLGDHLASRLTRLLRALDQGNRVEEALQIVEVLSRGWRDQRLSATPAWASDITDDQSPFELSVAFERTSETVRILTEPQLAAAPSLRASWRAAADIHEELSSHLIVKLDTFDKLSDLFEPPTESTERFAIWHSAVMSHEHGPRLKVYLNPAIHGHEHTDEVVHSALARLGLGPAWTSLAAHAMRRPGLDTFRFLGLDLHAGADARIKIYVAHAHATSDDLARALAQAPGFYAEHVKRSCAELLGGAGPFERRQPLTCYAFRRDTLALHSATLHLPVREYLSDDFEIARRVSQRLNLPQRVRFLRGLAAYCDRPLDTGSGLQTYVSLRASQSGEALTVYLAPELYRGALSTHDSHTDEGRP